MGDSHGICGGFRGDSCRFWGIHANRLRQTPRNLWDSWGIQMRQLTPIIILEEGIRRGHGKRGVVAVARGHAFSRILIPPRPVLVLAGGLARNGCVVLGAERLENEWEAPLGPD